MKLSQVGSQSVRVLGLNLSHFVSFCLVYVSIWLGSTEAKPACRMGELLGSTGAMSRSLEASVVTRWRTCWEALGECRTHGTFHQGLMNMVCLKMVTTPPMIFQKENDDWPMELGLAYFQTLRTSHWQREIWFAMILMIFGHFLTSKKLDCDHWFRKANPKPHQQTCFHCHPELLEHEIHVEIWIVLRHLLGRNGRALKLLKYQNWLVVWNMFYFPIYWE